MPIVEVTFKADLTEEQIEELDAADPALLHEYAPELAEEVVEESLGYRLA